jgi:hypothetical protein
VPLACQCCSMSVLAAPQSPETSPRGSSASMEPIRRPRNSRGFLTFRAPHALVTSRRKSPPKEHRTWHPPCLRPAISELPINGGNNGAGVLNWCGLVQIDGAVTRPAEISVVAPAVRAAAWKFYPGKRAATAFADSGRRLGSSSKHCRIARSRAGSISGHSSEGGISFAAVWRPSAGTPSKGSLPVANSYSTIPSA